MANYMAEVAKMLGVERKQKPALDQVYYYVEVNGNIDWNFWDNDAIDWSLYIIGNCYLTKEEAKADCNKWISIYTSDEVLEV